MARESISSVAVKEGKVRVKLPVNSEVVFEGETSRKAKVDLLPGDKITFKNDKYIVTKVDASRVNAHQVVFENATLSDLSNVFEDIYGYKLEFISDEIANKNLGAYVFHTNFDSKKILQTLAGGFGLKYEIKGEKIIISK